MVPVGEARRWLSAPRTRAEGRSAGRTGSVALERVDSSGLSGRDNVSEAPWGTNAPVWRRRFSKR
jgi:hypothetical protein